MTGPDDSSGATRPISVAELLAKNGTIGAPPVSGRRRRRRGKGDAVTVAELTGDVPVVDDDIRDDTDHPAPATHAHRLNATTGFTQPDFDSVDEEIGQGKLDLGDATIFDETEEADDQPVETRYWSEPEARWPKSPPQQPPRGSGPERSHYPRPARKADWVDSELEQPDQESSAEQMSPDPLDDYAAMPVDVMDTDVREAEPAAEDSAYVRSYLRASVGRLFGGKTFGAGADGDGGAGLAESDSAELPAIEEDFDDDHTDLVDLADLAGPAEVDGHIGRDERAFRDSYAWPGKTPGRIEALLRGGLVVGQSVVAVAFGAGLFIAFEELWRWNNIVALVLSVLVILGLVVGVRVVRQTEDIASTLTAVAVGALVTLGPLALLQSG